MTRNKMKLIKSYTTIVEDVEFEINLYGNSRKTLFQISMGVKDENQFIQYHKTFDEAMQAYVSLFTDMTYEPRTMQVKVCN